MDLWQSGAVHSCGNLLEVREKGRRKSALFLLASRQVQEPELAAMDSARAALRLVDRLVLADFGEDRIEQAGTGDAEPAQLAGHGLRLGGKAVAEFAVHE